MTMKKIGFIGFGRMAEAIYQGLVKSGLDATVLFSEKNEQRAKYVSDLYKLEPVSIDTLVSCCDTLFFAVKPQGFNDVVNEIIHLNRNKNRDLDQDLLQYPLMVSIMAGIGSNRFYDAFGPKTKFIRLMPNTPCLLGEGMTGLYVNEHVEVDEKNNVELVFNQLGKTLSVHAEEDLDVVTGLSGSGPAFLYQLAAYVSDISENSGLSRDEVIKLFSQTMVGAGKMLLETGKQAQELIDQVSSPGGTTVAGLTVLQQSNINKEFNDVINAAINRSKELGK